MIRPIFSLSSS